MQQNVIDTIKESLANNYNQKTKDLLESQENIMKLIDTQTQGALNKLRSLYQKEMNHLTAKTESINLLTSQITSDCDAAVQACDEDQPMQLLISQRQIMDKLNNLEAKEVPKETPQAIDFNYTSNHHNCMEQIQKLLPNLWDTNLTDRPPLPVVKSSAKIIICGIVLLFLLAILATIASSVFIDRTIAPQVDPSQCTIRLGQSINTPGYVKATVKIYDSDGIRMRNSGANVEASQLWHPLLIQNHHDGTYSFVYSTKFGDALNVRINGVPMEGSPFYIHKEVDYWNSFVYWQPLSEKRYIQHYAPTSMYLNWSVLQTVDYSGKNMTIGGAKVEVTQSEISFHVTDHNTGTYTFDYNPAFGHIHIKVNGHYIKDNPIYPVRKDLPSYCRIHIGQPTHSLDRWLKRATVYTIDGNQECLTTKGIKVEAYEDGEQLEVFDHKNGTYFFYYYED